MRKYIVNWWNGWAIRYTHTHTKKYIDRIDVCVCVCVCGRERKRDRERERKGQANTFLKVWWWVLLMIETSLNYNTVAHKVHQFIIYQMFVYHVKQADNQQTHIK